MFMETGSGAPKAGCKAGQKSGQHKHSCSGSCGAAGPCAQNTAHQLAESLGRAVDARDKRLFQHSEMVADISSLLARAHGLTSRQSAMVHMAAHLHDVGKIGIPDHILHKPGPLTPAEWEIMRQHPRMGADILRPVKLFCGSPGVCEIVLAHHERFDGLGYPFGLAGGDIPLGARIVAVADAFCAMTEERPYRPGLHLDHAVYEIERNAGIMFDPGVVADFLKLRAELTARLTGAAAKACAQAAPETPLPAVCHAPELEALAAQAKQISTHLHSPQHP